MKSVEEQKLLASRFRCFVIRKHQNNFFIFQFYGPLWGPGRCAMVGLNPPLATYGGYHCAQKQEMSISLQAVTGYRQWKMHVAYVSQ